MTNPAYSTAWATSVLQAIGAPVSQANLQFMAAWAQEEGNGGQNNPLNTTQPAAGSTLLAGNPDGVRNYPDPQTGGQATAETLMNGDYQGLIAALKKGTSAEVDAVALQKSPWDGNGHYGATAGGGWANGAVSRILGQGGLDPDTSGDAVAGGSSSAAQGTTKTCYWSISASIPLTDTKLGTVCLDPILWLSLGLVSTGLFVVGGALMAVSGGRGGKVAQGIVDVAPVPIIRAAKATSRSVRAAKTTPDVRTASASESGREAAREGSSSAAREVTGLRRETAKVPA